MRAFNGLTPTLDCQCTEQKIVAEIGSSYETMECILNLKKMCAYKNHFLGKEEDPVL